MEPVESVESVEHKEETITEEKVDFSSLKRGEVCPTTQSVRALVSFEQYGVSDKDTDSLNTLYIGIQTVLLHANDVLTKSKTEQERAQKVQEVELMIRAKSQAFAYEVFELGQKYGHFPMVLMKKLRLESMLYLSLYRTVEEICDLIVRLMREFKELHQPLVGKRTRIV